MCAIVGAYLKHPTINQIETLKRLFIESQIRGRHQTGLAYRVGNKIKRFVVEGDGEALVAQFDWDQFVDIPVLELTGHNRYSTSDLRYPQPIQVFDDFALAHNGVVTQDSPGVWGRYGYDLVTANDSELLYQCSYAGNEPLTEFSEASMAVCELHGKKGLRWYRNAKRPLYMVTAENGFFICSTKDIAKRAGLSGAKRCKPGIVYYPKNEVKVARIKEMVS